MSRFDQALAWILKIEGGYVDHPADRGGETKWGISRSSYPDLDIKNLTRSQAQAIYFQDYWLRARCDRLPERIDLATFDAAVLHGPKTAIVLLQQTLKVQPDGIYGEITNTAAWRAEPQAKRVIAAMIARRAVLMHDLTVADSTQAQFLYGWMRRLLALHEKLIA